MRRRFGAALLAAMVAAAGAAGCLAGDEEKGDGRGGGDETRAGEEPARVPVSRILNLTAEPASGAVPAQVTLRAFVHAEGGPNASLGPGNFTYVLAYGDGETDAGDHGDFPLERSHTYRVPRAYTATLQVAFDDGGTVERSIELAFALPDPPPIGHTTVLASTPAPGFPEGIAVDRDTAYVTGPSAFPGFLFGVGEQSRLWPVNIVTGQIGDPILITVEDEPRGLANLALDAQGRLYVASFQPGLGVLRIDPATGAQEVYAPIPDIPACGPTAPEPPACSPTALDRAPLPNDLAFDADGNLYVTDTFQATIWRVPPGGGEAVVWFQHEALDQNFGPNGIRLGPDGETLYVAITSSDTQPGHAAGIYTLPRVDQPAPGDLRLFHEIGGADGIAFGESGRLYLVLALDNQVVVLEADGTEAYRFPDADENRAREVPYNAPATLAFNDLRRSILVTNHAVFDGAAHPDHFAVLEAFVDDLGMPLARPHIP